MTASSLHIQHGDNCSSKGQKEVTSHKLELKDALEAQKLFAVGPGGSVKAPSQLNRSRSNHNPLSPTGLVSVDP